MATDFTMNKDWGKPFTVSVPSGGSSTLNLDLLRTLNSESNSGVPSGYFQNDVNPRSSDPYINGHYYSSLPSSRSGGFGGFGSLSQLLGGVVGREPLQEYTGNTSISLSPETAGILDLISKFSASGSLQDLLSGKTNQGMFQRGVVDPAQRDLERNVLPGVRDAYSGGPQGGGSAFWGGARAKAEQGARNSLQDKIAGLRYEDYKAAQDRSVQAGALLPSLTNALSLRESLAAENLNRGIDVHYKNQGLKDTQFKEDMDFINSLLGYSTEQDKINLSREQGAMQNATALRGQNFNLQAALWGQKLQEAEQRANQQFLRSILSSRGI